MLKSKKKWEKKIPSLQVMIVEDDMFIRVLIQQTIKEMGLSNITLAKDGKEAWEKFTAQDKYFDLILSDWMMPEMDGIEFLGKVREIDPGIAFLMLTAKSTLGDVEEARDLGVNAYIAKPFSSDELSQKVMWLMRQILDPDYDPFEDTPT